MMNFPLMQTFLLCWGACALAYKKHSNQKNKSWPTGNQP